MVGSHNVPRGSKETTPSAGVPREVDDAPAVFPASEGNLKGRYVTLEKISRVFCAELYQNLDLANDKELWQWLAGPWPMFTNSDELWERLKTPEQDPRFIIFAIKADINDIDQLAGSDITAHKDVVGILGYINIEFENRALETGAVIFGKALRQTAAATEAHYLMLRNVLEGTQSSPAYRRVAWKCNSLNTASRRAAERLGYKYEGTFRNHMIIRGHSRDSDWLSIIDDDWPVIREALETWLKPSNFDSSGKQLEKLDSIRRAIESRTGEDI